ncbi:MAG TPA: hypothetical protein VGK67_37230 [Myxococcales bacterium]|jgi:hypothetical protein
MSPAESSISLVTKPSADRRSRSPFGTFIDRLLQTFEDRRPGLTGETLKKGERACEQFFLQVYEQESARLREQVSAQEHLSTEARDALFVEVDKLIRTVVVPAYVRLTARFTPRERNDFYAVREGLHVLERLGWGVAGMAVGAFVVWAPFIPIWSKEAIVPFMVAGLFFPNLRSYFTFRRYEKDLNELVLRADREAGRIDVAYLLSDARRAELSPVQGLGGEAVATDSENSKTGVH